MTHEFLNLYRTLEELLEAKYAGSKRHHLSVIKEFLNDADSRPFREELNTCREIRNLLSHHPDMDGTPIVTPSQAVIDSLREIIAYVQRPPLALTFATRGQAIMRTTPNANLFRIMRAMEEHGFSHIPVLDKGNFVGVFSVSTVFSYILVNRRSDIHERTKIAQFADLLPIDHHISERFAFVPETATYYDVREAFERKDPHSKRLAAVFVTETGSSREPLLGLITPWDILGTSL